MQITIDGTEITDYIAHGGLKWTRSDIDGPDAGRSMDGVMHRLRVGTKIRLDITCRPLTATELRTLLNLIYPEYVTVVYDDPMSGRVSKTMYSNNNPASYYRMKRSGVEQWTGVTFPLVEV